MPKWKQADFTARQWEALWWAMGVYGGRKAILKRIASRPEDLRPDLRHFWRYPFGIPEWNEHYRILRRLYWQGRI